MTFETKIFTKNQCYRNLLILHFILLSFVLRIPDLGTKTFRAKTLWLEKNLLYIINKSIIYNNINNQILIFFFSICDEFK